MKTVVIPNTRFDYVNQAWIKNGRYIRCGHPESMQCDCYGRRYEGELAKSEVK